jgi:hypothetical protein
MKQSIIECIGRSENVDKNGKPYVRLYFKNWSFIDFFNPATGEVVYIREHSVIGNINQYPESYTSSKRPDPYYMSKVGDLITGAVIQKKVEPFVTEKGYPVNYYNAVVFGNSTEPDWEDRIKTAFRKEGRVLLPEVVVPKFDIAEEKIIQEEEKLDLGEEEESPFKGEYIDITNKTPEEVQQILSKIINK